MNFKGEQNKKKKKINNNNNTKNLHDTSDRNFKTFHSKQIKDTL